MPEPHSSADVPETNAGSPNTLGATKRSPVGAARGSPAEPLGWLSLAPSVSIAVFLIVAMILIDASSGLRIGLALTAGVLIGPLASYLLDTYWPRNPRQPKIGQRGDPPDLG